MFDDRFSNGRKKFNDDAIQNRGVAIKMRYMKELDIDDMLLEDNQLIIVDMSGKKTPVIQYRRNLQ